MSFGPREPRQIASRSNPLWKHLRRLAHEPGFYRRSGEVWLEGDHLCRALLARGGTPRQAVLSQRGWFSAELRALAEAAAEVAVVDDALFAELGTLESPAAIGFLIDAPDASAQVLQPGVASVVLDRLQDAGNVGSLLRSAAAFGVRQVVALKGTAALWSPKVLRAGMGAHFGLHLVEGVDAGRLEELDLPLVATSSHASVVLHEADLPAAFAWVFGHEGQGVSSELAARCALTLRIPQPGGEESLNVAAAAAVCFYEAARRKLSRSAGPA